MPCLKRIFRVNSKHQVVPLPVEDVNTISKSGENALKCDEYINSTEPFSSKNDCRHRFWRVPRLKLKCCQLDKSTALKTASGISDSRHMAEAAKKYGSGNHELGRANTWKLHEDSEEWTHYRQHCQIEPVITHVSSFSKRSCGRTLDLTHHGRKAAAKSHTMKKIASVRRPRLRAASIQEQLSGKTNSFMSNSVVLTKSTAGNKFSKESKVVAGVKIRNCPENLIVLRKVEKYRAMELELRLKALTERTAEVQRQLNSQRWEHSLRHDLEEEEDILFLLTSEALMIPSIIIK
uniref:Uncharacterized protein n=1 Tax=Fibrocapsa japonica TaxID=94617 RepID=A0A7S2V5D8_9STRA|mmetsp:Transcript_3730/g.5529  ORF Transcript_3730/g.5529 Transcript_3730/m.5529 type:complete len:292 (+) Transcript_3730:16-891(+)